MSDTVICTRCFEECTDDPSGCRDPECPMHAWDWSTSTSPPSLGREILGDPDEYERQTAEIRQRHEDLREAVRVRELANLFDELETVSEAMAVAGVMSMEASGPISAQNAVIIGQPKDVWKAMLAKKRKEMIGND